MKRLILGFLILLFFCNANLFAEDVILVNPPQKQTVRVGISDNNFSSYMFSKISITSDDGFVITDSLSKETYFKGGKIADIVYQNGEFKVYNHNEEVLKSNNKLTVIPSNNQAIGIVGLKRKSKTALYFGNIELEKSRNNPDSKFAVVNVLPLQTYLKGVVPNEMPTDFGLEALKAQAVLARNYVLKPREKYYKEFDICDSVACQVYFGANTQESLSDRAVDETENIIVTYNNDLILAVYSSTAGGYTESYKNVFMQNMQGRIMSPHVPYLVAVPDSQNIPKLDTEEKVRAFYSSTPETYDNKSPYFRWTAEWNITDLEKTLSKTLPSVKSTGFVKNKYPVDFSNPNFLGHIKSIMINKRGESGKIVALTIVTDKNEFTVYKELIIRKVFQYKNKILPSANVFFDFKSDENNQVKLTATGGGLGHGVGMSQWGAGAMAKKGADYKKIIHHYYTNVDISVLPVEIRNNQTVTREFYFDSKKAYLKVENRVSFKDLNIIINNKYVSTDLKRKLSKGECIEITHYLKHGKNLITYNVVGDKTENSVKFGIELTEKNE